jgi:hypothetical protein
MSYLKYSVCLLAIVACIITVGAEVVFQKTFQSNSEIVVEKLQEIVVHEQPLLVEMTSGPDGKVKEEIRNLPADQEQKNTYIVRLINPDGASEDVVKRIYFRSPNVIYGGVVEGNLEELRVFDAAYAHDRLYLAMVDGGRPCVEVFGRLEDGSGGRWVSRSRVQYGQIVSPPSEFHFLVAADGRVDPTHVKLGDKIIEWSGQVDTIEESSISQLATDTNDVSAGTGDSQDFDGVEELEESMPIEMQDDKSPIDRRWFVGMIIAMGVFLGLWWLRSRRSHS